MAEGKVLYANHLGIHVLRFIGDIRCTLAPTLETFIDRLFMDAEQAPFLVDLTRTRCIDSTNLGLLARIAIRMRKCGGPRVTLLSSRPDIDELLQSMGFDDVFDIQAPVGPIPGKARTLPIENSDRNALARTVLGAHHALMELNAHNRDSFQEVASMLDHREELRV